VNARADALFRRTLSSPNNYITLDRASCSRTNKGRPFGAVFICSLTDLRQFRPECGAQIVDMIDSGVTFSRKRGTLWAGRTPRACGRTGCAPYLDFWSLGIELVPRRGFARPRLRSSASLPINRRCWRRRMKTHAAFVTLRARAMCTLSGIAWPVGELDLISKPSALLGCRR
jgi:hypothetical protein